MSYGNANVDDRNTKLLRELSHQEGNGRCFECNLRGITYIDTTLCTFICTTCSGRLRGIIPPHRVKSISMAKFTPDEIEKIQAGGNKLAAAIWLSKWNPNVYPVPDVNDEIKFQQFLSNKYSKKLWYTEPSENSSTLTSSQSSQDPSKMKGGLAQIRSSNLTSIGSIRPRPNASSTNNIPSVILSPAKPTVQSQTPDPVQTNTPPPKESPVLASLVRVSTSDSAPLNLSNASKNLASFNDPFLGPTNVFPTSTEPPSAVSNTNFLPDELAGINFTSNQKVSSVPNTTSIPQTSVPDKYSEIAALVDSSTFNLSGFNQHPNNLGFNPQFHSAYPQQNINTGFPQQSQNLGQFQQNMNTGFPQQLQNTGQFQQNMNTGFPQQLQNTGQFQQNLNTGFPQQSQNVGLFQPNANPGAGHFQQSINTGFLQQSQNVGQFQLNTNPGIPLQSQTAGQFQQNTGFPPGQRFNQNPINLIPQQNIGFQQQDNTTAFPQQMTTSGFQQQQRNFQGFPQQTNSSPFPTSNSSLSRFPQQNFAGLPQQNNQNNIFAQQSGIQSHNTNISGFTPNFQQNTGFIQQNTMTNANNSMNQFSQQKTNLNFQAQFHQQQVTFPVQNPVGSTNVQQTNTSFTSTPQRQTFTDTSLNSLLGNDLSAFSNAFKSKSTIGNTDKPRANTDFGSNALNDLQILQPTASQPFPSSSPASSDVAIKPKSKNSTESDPSIVNEWKDVFGGNKHEDTLTKKESILAAMKTSNYTPIGGYQISPVPINNTQVQQQYGMQPIQQQQFQQMHIPQQSQFMPNQYMTPTNPMMGSTTVKTSNPFETTNPFL